MRLLRRDSFKGMWDVPAEDTAPLLRPVPRHSVLHPSARHQSLLPFLKL